MQYQQNKLIRTTLLILILNLAIGLGVSTPSLAQEPLEGGSDNPQASSTAFPLANFTQQAKLSPSDGQGGEFYGDGFGAAVAVTEDTILVGTEIKNAIYIYEKPADGSWLDATEVGQLTAADSGENDSFGTELAISGDTLFVGALGNDDWRGAVYIFAKPAGGSWVDAKEIAKLTAPEREENEYFGTTLAASDDTLFVGAHGNDNSQGAVYLLTKPTNGSWANATAMAKLTAAEREEEDIFGAAIAIEGDTLIVGMPDESEIGTAYIFEKPAGGWADMTETAKLTASDGEAEDLFGSAVAINGQTIFIGAWSDDTSQGGVYVFEKPASGWIDMTETTKLTASDGEGVNPEDLDLWESAAGDAFGRTIAVSGNQLFIGAPEDDQDKSKNGDSGSDEANGAVYLFEKPADGRWANATEITKFKLAEPGKYHWFGESVAISGQTLVIGASGVDDLKGAAYIFE